MGADPDNFSMIFIKVSTRIFSSRISPLAITDAKLPPFIIRVVSFGASIMMLLFEKVPLLLMKGLTVFQKDLLDVEPSLAVSLKCLFFDFLLNC